MNFNFNFNNELASALAEFNDSLRGSADKKEAFVQNPTQSVKGFLVKKNIQVEDPQLFHAHAIKISEALPSEPQRATRDRYIYIFRASGLFEFKVVPGSPTGDDSFMVNPTGACACCNCCVIEI